MALIDNMLLLQDSVIFLPKKYNFQGKHHFLVPHAAFLLVVNQLIVFTDCNLLLVLFFFNLPIFVHLSSWEF